jgi:hypothetical protein
MNRLLRRLIVFALAGALIYTLYPRLANHDAPAPVPLTSSATVGGGNAIAIAFEQHRSNVVVEASGTVSRVLADDNDGSRHQRFVVAVPSGHTVLIAHNIDLAPRVENLRKGDRIDFKGEYEWNPQGGVVHWTHRDPHGRHEAGWLRHDGRTYQ